METILKNEFLEIRFQAENSLMESIWTTEFGMGSEAYRDVCWSYLKKIQEKNPKALLLDSRKAEYIIVPEEQDWLNENIYPKTVEAGVRRLAFLVSEDFVMQISLEQTVQDSLENKEISLMEQSFFNDRQQAINWLMEI